MKNKLFILLSGLLFSGVVLSQNDYIRYYQLINKVQQNQEKKLNDSLTFYLKQAFELVDYIHIKNLELGKRIARNQKDLELLNFCKDEIRKSKENINLNLKAQLDSVGKEDQRVRSKKYYNAQNYYRKCLFDSTFNYKEKKRSRSKQLMEEWWRVDSSNVEFIKNVISKFGYPSEKLVSEETNDKVSIILLHYDKDVSNLIMGERLEIALKEGKIKPRMYAWIIDRHLLNGGKKQKYQSIPTPWVNTTESQRMEYNKNRFLIGLKPLDEIKIIIGKNSVKVKY